MFRGIYFVTDFIKNAMPKLLASSWHYNFDLIASWVCGIHAIRKKRVILITDEYVKGIYDSQHYEEGIKTILKLE